MAQRGTEVIKRVLSSFRDTADGMDQVTRNLTANEDSHTQQLNGLLADRSSGPAPKQLQLASYTGSSPARAEQNGNPGAVDGLHPELDHVEVGAADGGGVSTTLSSAGGLPGPNIPGSAGTPPADHPGGALTVQMPHGVSTSLGPVTGRDRTDRSALSTPGSPGGTRERT